MSENKLNKNIDDEFLEDDIFTVHCLDKELAEGIEDCAFVKVLSQLEEE